MQSPVLIISGTNRPAANSLKVARILLAHYRSSQVPAELFSLEQMPPEVFEPSSYASKPPAFVEVQNRVLASRGLHIVTPEYNGSFPGVLKYFIDMLKFPESFDRKPVAFVGVAAGVWGALRSVEQLQMIFGYRNAHPYPERVFIAGINQQLTEEGTLKDPSLNDRLAKQVKGFTQFTSCIASAVKA